MKKGEIMSDKQMDNTSDTQARNGEDAKQLSKQITQRIRKILRERNTTQTALANDIGVNTSQVSKWMNNENAISTLYLYKISKSLNVSMDWLCGNENEEDNTKNKVQINSFNDLLASFLGQYKYCVDNDIPFDMVKIRSLADEEPLKQVYLNFIGIDINDRYVNDFMDKLSSFLELKNQGKLTDEQFSFITKSMPDTIAKERENNIKKGEVDHTDPNHEEVITYDQEHLPF